MQANSSELITPPQVNSSLAERLRFVLKHFAIEQSELANAMDVKVDRVKSLVLERAKNLRSTELARLRETYGLRPEWLIHGELPMTTPVRRADEPAPPAVQAAASDRDSTVLAREMAGRRYGVRSSADAGLLQEVVEATAAELDRRGLQLQAEQRLRLYWGVFELSLAGREVNRAAISALINMVDPAARVGG